MLDVIIPAFLDILLLNFCLKIMTFTGNRNQSQYFLQTKSVFDNPVGVHSFRHELKSTCRGCLQ